MPLLRKVQKSLIHLNYAFFFGGGGGGGGGLRCSTEQAHLKLGKFENGPDQLSKLRFVKIYTV